MLYLHYEGITSLTNNMYIKIKDWNYKSSQKLEYTIFFILYIIAILIGINN